MSAEVDAGIADVILETWRAGLKTEFSCEGQWYAGCRRAYVLLPMVDAERWLRILVPATTTPADREADLERWKLRTGFSGPKKRRWYHSLRPYDPFDVSVRFSVSIHFPASDLEDILVRLRAHNARREARTDARKGFQP